MGGVYSRIAMFALSLALSVNFGLPALAEGMEDFFRNSFEITVPEYTGGNNVLNDFPLLVRLSEKLVPGFSYAETGRDGALIRFTDADGNQIPYDTDHWDPYGESAVWVKVPKLNKNTVIRMYYSPKVEKSTDLPPNDSREVWSDYVAVWHMDAGYERVVDSTGNGFDATMSNGFYKAAASSAIGGATFVGEGDLLCADYDVRFPYLATNMTVTGWVSAPGYDSGTLVFMGKKLHESSLRSGWSWEIGSATRSVAKLTMRYSGNGGTPGSLEKSNIPVDLTRSWLHIGAVINGATHRVYYGGQEANEGSGADLLVKTNALPFMLGAAGVAIDELRICKMARANAWVRHEYENATTPGYCAYSPITVDGRVINAWVRAPAMVSSAVEEGETPVLDPGEAYRGDATKTVRYVNRATGEDLGPTVPTSRGVYRAIVEIAGTPEYSELAAEVDFRIFRRRPKSDDLASDRVLLANDDLNEMAPVVSQSYVDNDPSYGSWYWTHDVDTDDDYYSTSPWYNFFGGTRHFYYDGEGLLAWGLLDVRIGNTFVNVGEDSSFRYEYDEGLFEDQNYLPWDPNSLVMNDVSYSVGGYQETVGQLVLRNVKEAGVYSRLYADGIGTIYFDAVNAFVDSAGSACRIKVQIATNSLTGAGASIPRLPTDDAIRTTYRIFEDGPELADPYDLADWQDVEMCPVEVRGSRMTALAPTKEFALAIADGGSYTNFYRFYVPLDLHGPVRFRIIRTSVDPVYTLNPDSRGLILMDNVIVSKPVSHVDILPYGWFDVEKRGKQTLGWENAWSVPFPGVGDADVMARARAFVDGVETNVTDLVDAATMHYRWRYLTQAEDWQAVDLVAREDGLEALEPLALPELPGDVEFWFESELDLHYYAYVDYSGTGLGLPDYSEYQGGTTNRGESAADWFVRLRDGRSNYESMAVVIRGAGGVEGAVRDIPMELVGDHVWRGYLQTPTSFVGTVEYRIEARNLETPGSKTWAWTTNCWCGETLKPKPDGSVLPATCKLHEATADDWVSLEVDAVTGYLMFRVDDAKMAVSIAHADYQNFNAWHDANKGAEVFVGSSAEDVSKSGTSPHTREYEIYYGDGSWKDSVATNSFWEAGFPDILDYGGNNAYEPFEKSDFGRWEIGPGMWSFGNYRDPKSGAALQMEGNGKGYLMLADRNDIMHGLESVSFNARLAQPLDFDNFSYYNGASSAQLHDYTFMSLAAFDLAANSNFTGNASLSLVARWNHMRGGYEARWEQLNGVIDSAGRTRGPQPNSQRLCLYRWNFENGTYRTTLLGAITNSVHFNFNMPQTLSVTNQTDNDLFLPIYISVTNEAAAAGADKDATLITIGVRKKGLKITDSPSTTTTNDYEWINLCYRDTSSVRHYAGSYGVASANCEGVFARPVWMNQAVDGPELCAEGEVIEDNVPVALVNKAIPFGDFDATSCKGDLRAVDPTGRPSVWTIVSGRAAYFEYDMCDGSWGLMAKPVAQTLVIEAAKLGTDDWETLVSTDLTGFGRAGTTAEFHFDLWRTKDYAIRFRGLGRLDEGRTDIVIDDVVLRQWRGENWLSDGSTSRAYGYGSTNFVYTSGWVVNGALRLSAKRTGEESDGVTADEVIPIASIRIPLMDGQSSGYYKYRGQGLGMVAFEYRNAQPNVNLLLQVATNNMVQVDNLVSATRTWDDTGALWTTVTNFDFRTLPSSGTISYYLGLHGVAGTARLVLDPAVVESVRTSHDPAAFGEIDITRVFCRDEPALDSWCWWGWNLRTTDEEAMQFLPDHSTFADAIGMSAGLNNSVSDCIISKDADEYAKHIPFIQSPTFAANVVGEVSFRARKYEIYDPQPAQLTLYGSVTGSEDDSSWEKLDDFVISNRTYATYTYKADQGKAYRALRFAVTGVPGAPSSPRPIGYDLPVRILLDELVISEGVYASLAFRNVGAFRFNLENALCITDILERTEQPMCEECWGVQAELFAESLEDEIDMEIEPEVILHWYIDEKNPLRPSVWGYDKWSGMSEANGVHAAPLARVSDSEALVYRSSYETAPNAVIMPSFTPGTVVQYMLEAIYRQVNPNTGHVSVQTNFLSSANWTVPEWLAPVDYNRDNKPHFAAFTILDNVAPGWAWINEANIFGLSDSTTENSEKYRQYIEVAHPAEVDLSGWEVRIVEAHTSTGMILTNRIAQFGTPFLPGTKDSTWMASNMVFRSIACPKAKSTGFVSKEDGTLDGTWTFDNYQNSMVCQYSSSDSYTLNYTDPFAIQLVRASGVIEHEIVVIGWDFWGSMGASEMSPATIAEWLNAHDFPKNYFYPGQDAIPIGASGDFSGEGRSLNVWDSRGESAAVWTNRWVLTPGKVNHDADGNAQQINPDHPTPNGDNLVVYANLDEKSGHIRQKVGDETDFTTGGKIVLLKKGSSAGLDIQYQVDRWYEIGSITTNGVAFPIPAPAGDVYRVNVGAGCSNNITVVAAAQLQDKLRIEYGLDEKNKYTPAVVDWLENGQTLRGPFEKDDGEIRLAEFWALSGAVITNMTLTQMYWLDMDPTVGNLIFQAGMYNPESVIREPVVPDYQGDSALTNLKMCVFMMISNRNETVSETNPRAWTPYVLRGLDPGYTSWNYTNGTEQAWTSVTFKTTGILANGLTSESNPNNWVALRWFVFYPDSFYQLEDAAEGHVPYTTEIEVFDPYSTASPGYAAGWYDWVRDNHWCPVFFSWAIDTKLRPISVERLRRRNWYDAE